MNVKSLIEMLTHAEPEATVRIIQCYGESMATEVTGMEFNADEVLLTDEETS